MTRIAIYARYSCDKQNPLSTSDQVERCLKLARRYGFPVENCRFFADEALSASGKDEAKRVEFQRLLAAWDANELDVILTDEWSRLTREGVEHALMVRRLEENRRVRLITGNGLDTSLPNWQLVAGLFGMVGQQSTRDTQYRVGRGMLGKLQRGYMIAAPAFGYDLIQEYDGSGRSVGARWVINEAQAPIVREIFSRRESGQSMHQIARWLNESHIPTSRKPRKNSGGLWRPSRIRNLLMNAIYKGEFEWHGSLNYKYKAEKLGVEVNIQRFDRPELRLVSNETWQRCQAADGVSRSGYGGGKHALAGLFSCGYCNGILSISGSKNSPSLCCAHCSIAKASGGSQEGLSITVAASGVQLLLRVALRHFLTPAFVDAFRDSLRRRLQGDNRAEIEQTESALLLLCRKQERLSRLLASSDDDDQVLATRYAEVRSDVRKAEASLEALRAEHPKVDMVAIEAQLAVNPAELLNAMFDDAEVAPERLRAQLSRLFPKLVLEGKTGRYTSHFRIQFATGVATAMASNTAQVDTGTQTLRFQLRYIPDNRLQPGERWLVSEIPSPPISQSSVTARYRPPQEKLALCAAL